MKTHALTQGSPEWNAHRGSCFNASDAPAMLGCSPYKTRTELLREIATGLAAEVDAGTQRRFDDGHRFEALARPLAEQITGDDLAPVVGSLEVEGLSRPLGASFDGLTMLGEIAFEHKTLNEELRAALHPDRTTLVPKHYLVQMEQQLLVSGAEKVLFMATRWEGDSCAEQAYVWYTSDDKLRDEILLGWVQFDADLADYVPPAAVPAVVAAPVQALPAVSVIVTGEIAVRENFAAFEVALRDFLDHRLIREPKTDQDFADLDVQIKAMKGAEAALDSAETQMLAQLQTVDAAKRTKDMLAKLVRDNRLMAEKLLSSEKERRRGEIVAGGVTALRDHLAALDKRLGRRGLMPQVAADFGGAIKGKKSLASMEDAVSTELARVKIAANEIADRIQANLAHLAEHEEHAHLFPDVPAIVQKAPDDLQALVAQRIATHRAAEEKRIEADRERIRAEEAAKLRREQEAKDRAAAEETARVFASFEKPAATPAPAPVAAPAVSSQAPSVVPIRPAAKATLRLGEIGALIAPLQIDAAGLARLGFQPVAVEKAAKLYDAASFPAMVDSLVAQLRSAAAQFEQRAA